MSRYDEYMSDRERIRLQTEAEFEFARDLESQGIDCKQFMDQLGLSLHQFNALAHCIYDVCDEEPTLPPALRGLLHAFRATHVPRPREIAAAH
jgi:hypothetical protein